jgi:tRNA(Ile)-lysidine synthase
VRLHHTPPLEFDDTATVLELRGRAGELSFGKLQVQWRLATRRGDRRPTPASNREFFDADAVGSSITLRHWRAGDRFQPIGLPQAAKLQDLFTNARIPREQRRSLVVAEAADGRLFWVEGLRIGEAFRLTARTNRRLQWRWQRL